MGSAEGDNRGGKRVEYHFMVRIRPVNSFDTATWDISTIRNISETGVLFYSSKYYDYNAYAEIKIKNPIIPEEIDCLCKVVRCELLKDIKNIYSVAVNIVKMEPKSRKAYDETIKLFIKRSERPK